MNCAWHHAQCMPRTRKSLDEWVRAFGGLALGRRRVFLAGRGCRRGVAHVSSPRGFQLLRGLPRGSRGVLNAIRRLKQHAPQGARVHDRAGGLAARDVKGEDGLR